MLNILDGIKNQPTSSGVCANNQFSLTSRKTFINFNGWLGSNSMKFLICSDVSDISNGFFSWFVKVWKMEGG